MKITTEAIKKLLAGFNEVVKVAVLIFVSTMFYAMFLEQPYLSYPNMPMRVIGSTFHVGDVVPVEFQRCNSDPEAKSFLSSRALINTITRVPEIPILTFIEAKPGCTEIEISALNVIPAGTKPGIYHYGGRSDINGLLRTFDVRWYTQDFEVVP